MSDLKIGDIVTPRERAGPYKPGQPYTITSKTSSSIYLDGGDAGWWPGLFRLMETEPPTPAELVKKYLDHARLVREHRLEMLAYGKMLKELGWVVTYGETPDAFFTKTTSVRIPAKG